MGMNTDSPEYARNARRAAAFASLVMAGHLDGTQWALPLRYMDDLSSADLGMMCFVLADWYAEAAAWEIKLLARERGYEATDREIAVTVADYLERKSVGLAAKQEQLERETQP